MCFGSISILLLLGNMSPLLDSDKDNFGTPVVGTSFVPDHQSHIGCDAAVKFISSDRHIRSREPMPEILSIQSECLKIIIIDGLLTFTV